MGKNVSGTGMDPNVIGMWRRLPELPPEPDYRWLAVLGLTEQSHGNAVGIGMADLTSRKLTECHRPRSHPRQRAHQHGRGHGEGTRDATQRP